MAEAKTATTSDKRPTEHQSDEPAKGGLKPAHEKPYRPDESLKKQGDKLEHAADEAARKND